MQFNLPTTKEQMYQILNDLFYYYRVRRESYEEVALKELTLSEMEFTPLTEEELLLKAQTLMAAEHEREITGRKSQLSSKIKTLETQLSTAENGANENIVKLEEMYEDSQEKLKEQAVKNGLINSSIYLDKLAFLENEKINKISEINDDLNDLFSTISAEIKSCEDSLDAVDDYFAAIHQKAIAAKAAVLKDEQEKIEREVFEYNNSLKEKKQRYKNDILKANASLNLQFLEISVAEFTKDQLVEMGYYEDVVRCVCGYYDTLDSVTAYQSINSDKKVAIYLDDYYQNIVYMYGVRSGLIG